MFDLILEDYPEETFLRLDNFDRAIIGVEESSMKLIYSVEKCIEILCEDMEYDDALEYFNFNVIGGYLGEKTPIFCQDNFKKSLPDLDNN